MALIRSLRCERLASNKENLRLINSFYSTRNNNVAEALLNEAYKEDESGVVAYYVVKTYYTSSHIYGMLQNMAECLGYDQDVCSMLQNEEYEKVSYRRQLKDNYAFKYGQAALYELYGWLLLNGKLENEYVGTFRTPLVRIDPSFPIVLQKCGGEQ